MVLREKREEKITAACSRPGCPRPRAERHTQQEPLPGRPAPASGAAAAASAPAPPGKHITRPGSGLWTRRRCIRESPSPSELRTKTALVPSAALCRVGLRSAAGRAPLCPAWRAPSCPGLSGTATLWTKLSSLSKAVIRSRNPPTRHSFNFTTAAAGLWCGTARKRSRYRA